MQPNSTSTITALALVAASALGGGCAGAAFNTDAPTSEIRAAHEVGAAKTPQAALHLRLAKEELAKAKRLSADGDDKEAASMLTRSQADAELAVALARNATEKQAAMDALARVRELRTDNENLDATATGGSNQKKSR